MIERSLALPFTTTVDTVRRSRSSTSRSLCRLRPARSGSQDGWVLKCMTGSHRHSLTQEARTGYSRREAKRHLAAETQSSILKQAGL